MASYDVIVVGAGMSGSALAYEASKHSSVVLLEREEQPGYHSTGRSAAAFIPSYGQDNRALHLLTAASFDFLNSAPQDFSTTPLLKKRGLLTICANQQDAESLFSQLAATTQELAKLSRDQIVALLPLLHTPYIDHAVFEPNVYDIEVDALHQGYLRGLQANNGDLFCNTEITNVQRKAGAWRVTSKERIYSAPRIVNATGAWADEFAKLAGMNPLGITPLRRTAVTVDPPAEVDVSSWPLVLSASEGFYFKPDAGSILVSPADEHPSPPTDAQPHELDIAYAMHFAEKALNLADIKPKSAWAGLRTFCPDRTPAIGYDVLEESFFWLCGQGGHGIQTAPASARLAASLLLGENIPEDLKHLGFDPTWVSPARFRA